MSNLPPGCSDWDVDQAMDPQDQDPPEPPEWIQSFYDKEEVDA